MENVKELERRIRMLEERVSVLSDRVEIYQDVFRAVLNDLEQLQINQPKAKPAFCFVG